MSINNLHKAIALARVKLAYAETQDDVTLLILFLNLYTQQLNDKENNHENSL